MSWSDDDMPVGVKRGRGRPDVSPFPSDEMEKDFVVRCGKMIETYFTDSQSKNSFVFTKNKHMSKTLFWSIIYIYYLQVKGLSRNLDGFRDVVAKHFGTTVLSSRTTLLARVGSLESILVYSKYIDMGRISQAIILEREIYCPKYQYVVGLWDTCV